MPEIRLDHNETVVGTTVYSNALTNPFSGMSFSEEARRLLKQKRKRDDDISTNTNAVIDASLQRLAELQEWIKPETKTPYAYQFGTTSLTPLGPGLPPPDRRSAKQRQQFWNQSPAIHLPRPLPTYYLPEVTITDTGPIPTRTLPEVTITAKKSTTSSKTKKPASTTTAPSQPRTPVPPVQPLPTAKLPQSVQSLKGTRPLPPLATTPSDGNNQKAFEPEATPGDWLQAATIASRFLNLLDGPARLDPALDDTQIRENLIDDTSTVNRIRRLAALRQRAVGGNSPAIASAVANAMQASAIQAESDVRTQIAQDNAARRSQVDAQRSAQRRYNAAVINQVRQYNQTARDAHRMAMDNAFESLGYLGQAMNERQQAYEILNLYRKVYPHAFG